MLCSAIVSVAEEKCPAMLPQAREVYGRHKEAIVLFGKCHNGYNGRVLSNEDIDALGNTMILIATMQ